MSVSIFEVVVRNQLHFEDTEYQRLYERLRAIADDCERMLGAIPERFSLRWLIRNTVSRSDMNGKLGGYRPVLRVEAEIVMKHEPWSSRRCPYVIFVTENMTRIWDAYGNPFDFDVGSASPVASVVANTLRGVGA